MVELLTYSGQLNYYVRVLNAKLKDLLHDYLINEIVQYTIDLDAAGFQCIGTLKGHFRTVTCCCVLPNGNIVSASDDDTLKL